MIRIEFDQFDADFIEKRRTLDYVFGDVFANKLDFGCHFGLQWISEGGLKTTFLAIMLEETGKMRSRSGSGANMKFRQILEAEMRGSEKQNVVISFDLLQNMRFRRSRNFMKMEIKMASNIHEQLSFGRPWAGKLFFGRFLEVLDKCGNLRDF